MTVENPANILHRLENDPCLAFLEQTFTCIDDEFGDSDRIIEAHGDLPVAELQYTLIEIRYTHRGFVGNFRELPPRDRDQGFHLRRFKTNAGFHPHWLLVSDLAEKVTRAKFGTRDYRPANREKVRYAEVTRPSDSLPAVVYNFDPLLLKHPVRFGCQL